jgi:plasmid maintenance system antidote protein VapI
MALKVAKFAAVLGGVAVAALVAMTKAGLASVDMVAKLARALNTGTEGIIALQHAAKLGGVSVEKMDKAIIKMFKNVGEATTGLGLAKDSLDAMGLSATDLSQMDADAMFGAIAGGLMSVEAGAVRAFHANALFGKSGVDLIPIMLKGAAGIQEMRKEADELGITFGIKQAAMVEKANDAWARIGSIWKGLTQQLAINFAPMLELIARRIKEMIISGGGVGAIAELVVLSVAKMGAAVFNMLNKVHSGWQTFKAAIIAGGGQVLEWWGDIFDDQVARDMAKSMFDQAGGS